MPGITAQITKLLIDYINTDGVGWLALLGGQFYRENQISEKAVAPFAEWGWVSDLDRSTSTEPVEEDRFQIVFYGDDSYALDEIRDAANLTLDTTTYGQANIGSGILIFHEQDSGFRAIKNEDIKKDRFGKFVAMSQFEFRVQKQLT